jgi:hypothetical protein
MTDDIDLLRHIMAENREAKAACDVRAMKLLGDLEASMAELDAHYEEFMSRAKQQYMEQRARCEDQRMKLMAFMQKDVEVH